MDALRFVLYEQDRVLQKNYYNLLYQCHILQLYLKQRVHASIYRVNDSFSGVCH
jgi:hypothetical protein